jgi:hypothetical protein
MRDLINAWLVVTIVAAAGCANPPSAPSPAPIVNQDTYAPPPPPPPPWQSVAQLAIEDFSVVILAPTPWKTYYSYEPRFLLRETSGKSAATLQEIKVTATPGFSEVTGPRCVGPMHVPAGGTLDLFYTDANLAGLAYCSPFPSGTGNLDDARQIEVVVTFTDDAGGMGTAKAIASITR